MSALNESTLKALFLDARTYNGWLDKPVTDEQLQQIYDLTRMGPTAINTVPLRVVFVKHREAKERLRPTLTGNNVDKTMNAPATAILAYDRNFHEQMPKLFPSRDLKSYFEGLPEQAREQTASMNATLQAGYFILAARALGLDAGPMGGFNKEQVDAEFFRDEPWKSFLLVNLGYGDPKSLFPRNPRLSFEEAGRIE
jgi:3-hydroxypropanoate dehydrogenase